MLDEVSASRKAESLKTRLRNKEDLANQKMAAEEKGKKSVKQERKR
jgi:hypothetical protein